MTIDHLDDFYLILVNGLLRKWSWLASEEERVRVRVSTFLEGVIEDPHTPRLMRWNEPKSQAKEAGFFFEPTILFHHVEFFLSIQRVVMCAIESQGPRPVLINFGWPLQFH
jgi:hypothetical protein